LPSRMPLCMMTATHKGGDGCGPNCLEFL
jgi:hypothetical protein